MRHRRGQGALILVVVVVVTGGTGKAWTRFTLHPDSCAAQGSTLVVGGGAKCSGAWRYFGARAEAGEGEEEEEEKPKEKKEKKKKRLEKKEQIGSRQSRMA